MKVIIDGFSYEYLSGVVTVVEDKPVSFIHTGTTNNPEMFLSQYIVEDVVNMDEADVFQLITIDPHLLNVLDLIAKNGW
ncbi:hypothetical protein [Pantoea sp. FN0305]|uniref:hypothetical protein n=1 Tax=Pantoea sp. FN0305 TaxID=3418559 RepID=UPI003CE72320